MTDYWLDKNYDGNSDSDYSNWSYSKETQSEGEYRKYKKNALRIRPVNSLHSRALDYRT